MNDYELPPIVVACFVVRLAEKQPAGRLRSDESGLLQTDGYFLVMKTSDQEPTDPSYRKSIIFILQLAL